MTKIVLGVIALGIVIAGGYWLFTGSNAQVVSSPSATTTAAAVDAYNQATSSGADTPPPQVAAAAVPAQPTTNQQKNIMHATLHTSKGDITIEFDPELAPNAVANFIKLAQSGFYDGTKFHRVIQGFMDQAGDPLSKDDSKVSQWGTGGPGYQFPDEITPQSLNNAGTVAMANSGPNTNGSQFYINAVNNNFLDGKYVVFAHVTSGMDVVTAINNVPTGQNDRPLEPVVINSVTVE